MSEFTSGEPFDPAAFDPDVFLRENLTRDTEQEFRDLEENLETIRFEDQVIAALAANGLDLSRLNEARTLMGNDKPLSEVIRKFNIILEKLGSQAEPGAIPELEMIIAVVTSDMITATRISKIETSKSMADIGQVGAAIEYKEQVQAEIYADATLSPRQKTSWLTTIDTMLPDVVGLSPTDPTSILAVDEYEASRQQDEDILLTARALRPAAHESLVAFMQANNLGHHDSMEDLASSLVVGLTRYHVIHSGNYDEDTKEISEFVKRNIIDGQAREAAIEMGWTQEQFDAAVEHILNDLRKPESQ